VIISPTGYSQDECKQEIQIHESYEFYEICIINIYYIINSMTSFFSKSLGFAGCVLLALSPLAAQDPGGAEVSARLQAAARQVEEGGGGSAQLSLLRRHAQGNEPEARRVSRLALARRERAGGNAAAALQWLEEYAAPLPANRAWPVLEAHLEAALCQFDLGRSYEALRLLQDARDHAPGLGRIHASRQLSLLLERQADLSAALEHERAALKHGTEHFRRERDTEGRGPAKPGHETFAAWKPDIEARIARLARLLDIESYGLDFVLYSEAQALRKADHPLALDFTNVRSAFDRRAPADTPRIPGADHAAARERYLEIVQAFPDNPYGEASRLHAALCLVPLGQSRQALAELTAFIRDNPEGLYRGEAWLRMGDIHLFHHWDAPSARDAYQRATAWFTAMKERTRVIQTYLVPEKSETVSRPPRTLQVLGEYGQLQTIPVPTRALVNRNTADWYLDHLNVETHWRLGFLGILADDWDLAFVHFDKVLAGDELLQKAVDRRYFNAYDRLKIAKRSGGSMLAWPEQDNGLEGPVRAVMLWADFQLMQAEFDKAKGLYLRIQQAAPMERLPFAHTRAVAGEMVCVQQITGNLTPHVERLLQLVNIHPRAPVAPMLLEFGWLGTVNNKDLRDSVRRKIYTEYPNSKFAARTRFYEVVHLPWLDHSERERLTAAFIRDYPNEHEYHKSLETLDRLNRQYDEAKQNSERATR